MAFDRSQSRASPEGVVVVPAEGIDRRVCRMLLPDRPGAVGWQPLFVAKDVATGSILGAAKGMPAPEDGGGVHLRVAIHVPGPFRRRGVGGAILDALADHARRLRCTALCGLPEPHERDVAGPFLVAYGFREVDRMTTFEARVSVMAEWLGERRRWLEERGEIPATMRIVPLSESHAAAVAALQAAAIGGTPAVLEECFRDLARGPEGCDSVVLLVDGAVRGFHHCDFRGDLSTTHALAVTEELRGGVAGSGWAALALLADRVDACLRRDAVRSRFSCLSHVRATLRLARIFRATTVEVRGMLRCDLATRPPATLPG